MSSSMKKRKVILDMCDTLLCLVRVLRDEYNHQTASEKELLCGEWEREGSLISFRIFEDDGIYRIENRSSNAINGHVCVSCHELKEDENGNLYMTTFEWAVGYDSTLDLLKVEGHGDFKRKKTENEN